MGSINDVCKGAEIGEGGGDMSRLHLPKSYSCHGGKRGKKLCLIKRSNLIHCVKACQTGFVRWFNLEGMCDFD